MTGNPFYVHPGGDMTQGLQGLGQTFNQIGEQKRADALRQEEKDIAESAATKFAMVKTKFTEAVQSGDKQRVADVMFEFPELTQAMKPAYNFQNKITEENAVEAAWEVWNNPDNTIPILQERVKVINDEGGDPSHTIKLIENELANPGSAQAESAVVLSTFANEAFKTHREAVGGDKDSGDGTANMQDYEYYQKLLKEDPSKAEAFARQAGITKKPEKVVTDTEPMRNFDKWQNMPEGDEKDNFGTLLGLTGKTATVINAQIKKQEALQVKVDTADETVSLIDDLLSNPDYIASLVGIRGKSPAIPGTAGYDAEVIFNQFKDTLTLGNLDKMTGVLSETDIKILSSAAAGLKAGMSEKRFTTKLKEIRDRIETKGNRSRTRLTGVGKLPDPLGLR